MRLCAWGVDGTRASYDSDVAYFEPDGRKVVIECSRLAITQSSIAGSGALAGPSAVLNLLRAKENARCNKARASAIVDNDEGNTLFIPIVITSCGGFGAPSPSTVLPERVRIFQENIQCFSDSSVKRMGTG